jgi:hypothetical protein
MPGLSWQPKVQTGHSMELHVQQVDDTLLADRLGRYAPDFWRAIVNVAADLVPQAGSLIGCCLHCVFQIGYFRSCSSGSDAHDQRLSSSDTISVLLYVALILLTLSNN